ncbi:MAG: leucine-rich repeat domain-containing protein [Paludibacteraceae bacterium]|nr:leucine-rich repeat domain-containing protein [Paludibacteraceae bacterium]
MKKIIVFCVAFLATMSLWASETSVNAIWYDFDNESKTASVTYRGYGLWDYSDEYTGEVVIPSTVTYEGEEYSVKSIGDDAFFECSSLTTITLPEGVTEIGRGAFGYCTSLTSITLPEGVKSIGDDAFFECSSLTSITLPEGVTEIGRGAFANCSSLTSITLPESVTSIGEVAFDCSSLASITSMNATPPSIDGYHGFEYVDKSITLYVPAESVEAYKNADYWKEFTNIQVVPSSSVANAKAETQDSVRKEYRDGQVLIIKGDKIYTMFGTEN